MAASESGSGPLSPPQRERQAVEGCRVVAHPLVRCTESGPGRGPAGA